MTSLTIRSRERSPRDMLPAAIIAALLLGIAYIAHDGVGLRPLLLAGAAAGGLTLLARPWLAPTALLLAATMVPLQFYTGTEVTLNTATLLPPVLAGLWLVRGIVGRGLHRLPTPADRPWLLFVAAGLLSLVIGRATWDPAVPQPPSFLVVQLGQWAIFAIAALTFWLPGLTLRGQKDLERLAWTFLYVAGGLALLRLVPGVSGLVAPVTTTAFIRAPFWALMAALAGGQLLFNTAEVRGWRRAFLVALLIVAIYESTFHGRLSISEWGGVWVVLAVLVWLRFPRFRWLAAAALIGLLLSGVLFPTVYEFAGGDARWAESGGSRLVLIERVLSVTMRNPLTGLGPAAYRPYAAMQPLFYGKALWFHPLVNSHNNYVDLFAHGGLLGLALFGWLAVTILRWARGLARSARDAFASAYANSMVALWVSMLVIMLLADWVFPFVYNIGFSGFQAAILMWLFVGGLAVLQRSAGEELP